ncbi:hypothetical protein [Flavobacterium sp.]|uniref:hypothetical protein n=1 Tax=Flavobacterium sp. TaxID=239 RepID=UPI002B4B9466|nr:hypothetical protein [Flavobacterium sp.]HLF53528.1 hypothetical protein [Flavobacterium sp.]
MHSIKDTSRFIEMEALTSMPFNSQYKKLGDSSTIYKGTFVVAVYEDNIYNCVSGIISPPVRKWLSDFHITEMKENLYVTAIENLYKKIDYLQLTMQYNQELIDEAEFDYELETHEDRYLIKVNDNFSTEEFDIAMAITQKLKNRIYSSDEVAEMFSIPLEKVDNLLVVYEQVKYNISE